MNLPNLLCSNISNITVSLGLVFDILGVVILFIYGLPSKFHEPPKRLLEQGLTKEEVAENIKIERWAKIGLALLIFGFTFQLIGQWLS